MFDDLDTNDQGGQKKEGEMPKAKVNIGGNINEENHLFDKKIDNADEKIDDIFSETDNSAKPVAFQPKEQVNPGDINNINNPMIDDIGGANNTKKIITLFGIVIAVIAIVLGGYFLINKYLPKSDEIENNVVQEENKEESQNENNSEMNNNMNDETEMEDEEEEMMEDELNKDSDQDGLTDIEEIELGLDIENADSDEDGLFDREEVKIYRTDPLNKDSDGDGYEDGAEVKGGYNPNGEGKLFELP